MPLRTHVPGPRPRAGALFFLAAAVCLSASARAAPPAPAELSLAERQRIPGQIAFISERDGNRDVFLIRPSGEDERPLTRAPTAEYPSAVARDGSFLILVSVEEKAGLHLEQLWFQPLDGRPARPFGPRSGRARDPSLAPDGSWLVFESDAESFGDLFRIRPDGSGLERLTHNPQGNFEPAVSPDGTAIAFASSRDGDPEIYRMRSDGTRVKRLTAFYRQDFGPRWSPDGKRLAFLSDREGFDRIFVMDADGTHLRPLTGASGEARAKTAAPPSAPESQLAWSPDGTRIAYVTRRAGERSRIWIADACTGERRALTDGAHADDSPEWSPDGRYLVFVSDRTGDAELFLMRADGSGQTRLTHAKGADWLPRWIPAATGAKPR